MQTFIYTSSSRARMMADDSLPNKEFNEICELVNDEITDAANSGQYHVYIADGKLADTDILKERLGKWLVALGYDYEWGEGSELFIQWDKDYSLSR